MRAIIAAACFALIAHSADAQGISRHPPVTTLQVAGTTSATANTFTTALAADNGTRTGCSVTNTGEGTLYVFIRRPNTPVGTVAASIPVTPGNTYRCFEGEQGEVTIASNLGGVSYVLQSE